MRSILVISDMHVGSATALCTPRPVISETQTFHKPNALQAALYTGWRKSIRSLYRKPDYIVINGEPIDGANAKQLGNESWTTNLGDQIDDAEKLLRMLPDSRFVFVRGSGYHVNQDGTNFEEILAKRMGGIRSGTSYATHYRNIELAGHTVNFAHHVGFSRHFAGRPAALAREMSAVDSDVIVRSHVHYFCRVDNRGKTGITTPAWKLPDGHLFRGGLGGTIPDIGMVEILLDREVGIRPILVPTPYPEHKIKK